MVPQSSSPPPESGKQLSAETVEHLRAMLGARWRELEESEGQLRRAVRAAASEAKARGLQPEQLILTLKEIEADVFAAPGAVRAADQGARERFHRWLVATCLDAYFGEH